MDVRQNACSERLQWRVAEITDFNGRIPNSTIQAFSFLEEIQLDMTSLFLPFALNP